jgi:hypothetical protein
MMMAARADQGLTKNVVAEADAGEVAPVQTQEAQPLKLTSSNVAVVANAMDAPLAAISCAFKCVMGLRKLRY